MCTKYQVRHRQWQVKIHWTQEYPSPIPNPLPQGYCTKMECDTNEELKQNAKSVFCIISDIIFMNNFNYIYC